MNRFPQRLVVSVGALAVLTVAALALLGGGGGGSAEARAAGPGLRAFGSCDGLRLHLARHRQAVSSAPFPEALADSAAAPAAGAETRAEGTPTNVQEAGVDEPDIVKSAGSTLFTVDGNVLRAVDTSGGVPVLSGSIELPRGPANARVGDYQLLVAGDRLLAIGSAYGYATGIEGDVIAPDVAYPGRPRTLLAEVDVSDPAAMAVSRTMAFDGSYVSARLTGSTVRLVSSDYPWAGSAESGHGRALVPRMTIRDRSSGGQRRGRLVGCDDVRRPARFAGTGMLSVLTIDLRRGLPAVDTDAVLTDGQIVYASPTALYVATERWDTAAGLAGSQVRTEIHRFDTTDPEATGYVASGAVAGHMLSQWSMSEQDGVLRVASTTSPPFDAAGDQLGSSETFVTALAPDGDRLRRVGRVGGLGRGEQVYAVRFVGDTGYVVTFRQVDPLYVLDLSDPTAPRVTRRARRSRATPRTCTPSVPGCCSASDATRRPTAPPGECRSRCSTSRTPRTRCGSTASRSEPPPAPRSSTTTTRSPGSPTRDWRRCRSTPTSARGWPTRPSACASRRARRTCSGGWPGSPAGPRTAPRSGARSSSAVASTRSRPTGWTPTSRRR